MGRNSPCYIQQYSVSKLSVSKLSPPFLSHPHPTLKQFLHKVKKITSYFHISHTKNHINIERELQAPASSGFHNAGQFQSNDSSGFLKSFFPWEIYVILQLFLIQRLFFFFFKELSIHLNFYLYVSCPDKNSASPQPFRSSQSKRDSRVLLVFWRHRTHWDPWVSFSLLFIHIKYRPCSPICSLFCYSKGNGGWRPEPPNPWPVPGRDRNPNVRTAPPGARAVCRGSRRGPKTWVLRPPPWGSRGRP